MSTLNIQFHNKMTTFHQIFVLLIHQKTLVGTQKRVRISHGKRAISVRAIEVRLYLLRRRPANAQAVMLRLARAFAVCRHAYAFEEPKNRKVPVFVCWLINRVRLDIQSNLVISNSLISNYRLSRSENLVPVLT